MKDRFVETQLVEIGAMLDTYLDGYMTKEELRIAYQSYERFVESVATSLLLDEEQA